MTWRTPTESFEKISSSIRTCPWPELAHDEKGKAHDLWDHQPEKLHTWRSMWSANHWPSWFSAKRESWGILDFIKAAENLWKRLVAKLQGTKSFWNVIVPGRSSYNWMLKRRGREQKNAKEDKRRESRRWKKSSKSLSSSPYKKCRSLFWSAWTGFGSCLPKIVFLTNSLIAYSQKSCMYEKSPVMDWKEAKNSFTRRLKIARFKPKRLKAKMVSKMVLKKLKWSFLQQNYFFSINQSELIKGEKKERYGWITAFQILSKIHKKLSGRYYMDWT